MAIEEQNGLSGEDTLSTRENEIFSNDKEREYESEKEREAREKQEQLEKQERARKRRLIPPFVMLFAGAIVSITMRIRHYDMQQMLVVLLCVLLVFFVIGEVIRYMLDQFEKQNEESNMKEGEVIEKAATDMNDYRQNSGTNEKEE